MNTKEEAEREAKAQGFNLPYDQVTFRKGAEWASLKASEKIEELETEKKRIETLYTACAKGIEKLQSQLNEAVELLELAHSKTAFGTTFNRIENFLTKLNK